MAIKDHTIEDLPSDVDRLSALLAEKTDVHDPEKQDEADATEKHQAN